MKSLLELLTRSIASNPDAVSVESSEEGDWTDLRISVAPEDMGTVIGKGGKTIRSLREIVKIKAIKEGRGVNVELTEVDKSETSEPLELDSSVSE